MAKGKSKKEKLEEQIAQLVGAGKEVKKETVDFSDPNRPLTCLEVDFPIIPVNQIATIEGKGSGALKPIYQVMKWWARRRSTVFRQILISAAMKAPEDHSEAAKEAWSVYYANHQKKGAFRHLQVADIFMGGGTTLVEGSRLGMQMHGNDLNPVAWLVVKNELVQVNEDQVRKLIDHIELEVKPQIMPYYACDCPRGHKGKWIEIATGKIMDGNFDPLAIAQEDRKKYHYEGPEVIYTFWVKHGSCHTTGCEHRTPIISSLVVAEKKLSTFAIECQCSNCRQKFDAELGSTRMAPGVQQIVIESEQMFTELSHTFAQLLQNYNIGDAKNIRKQIQQLQKLVLKEPGLTCPACKTFSGEQIREVLDKHELATRVSERPKKDFRIKRKVVQMYLLIHPKWLNGDPGYANGKELGGYAGATADDTALWYRYRLNNLAFLEIRGQSLPKEITLPNGSIINTQKNTVPKKSTFACSNCGRLLDITDSERKAKHTSPVFPYVLQCYCPECEHEGFNYAGRYFKAPDALNIKKQIQVEYEWDTRCQTDLSNCYPISVLPFAWETHVQKGNLTKRGYSHWWKMFNPRQLLVHAQLLKTITKLSSTEWEYDVREQIIGVFQQYLRNHNMFCFWNRQRALEPHFSNNNYHPKAIVIENSVFSGLGRGDFSSCASKLLESSQWVHKTWEIACPDNDAKHSSKVFTNDSIVNHQCKVYCNSSTELPFFDDCSMDMIITDPPFGNNIQYSELADFFYVWLRLTLKDHYPEIFGNEYTPKTLEAVSNTARHPDDPDEFYQRVLMECWKETFRILKPGGILAFTFHHSEDEPWVAVLESLFEAGFYLVATYPIRSDETKGKGEFGSQKIEYDIIHVCRKRLEETKPVSWARMRRQVMQDIQQLKGILEHHQQQGLAAADIKVIKRGKALEYFSRHYGKVFAEEGRSFTVQEALAGINQILDEELDSDAQVPPVEAEPFTRQFLRLFYKKSELPRDQMQKHLRGTGVSPEDFVKRGWCSYKKKMFTMVPPDEIADQWKGKSRSNMNRDYEQMMFLIGACFEQSGINVKETLNNPRFKPHPATLALLKWMGNHGASEQIRYAAQRAERLYVSWQSEKSSKVNKQMELFDLEEE